MDEPTPCDPVGTKEIAERLGLQRNTVDEWRNQRRAAAVGFPPPKWEVGGRPAWEWADVRAWGIVTGRIDPDDAWAATPRSAT